MTALNTFFLILGMAVIGVPIILGLLGPIAGAVVVRVFPESAWDGVMLLFAQGGAAAATVLVGRLAVGLPWVACVIAALLVGITSYARRAPEPYLSDRELGFGLIDHDHYAEPEPEYTSATMLDEGDLDRTKEVCPECGKGCRGQNALAQHMKAKHSK